MAQDYVDQPSQQAQLLPTKDTLTALKSDVNLESACLELCDNALDAWKQTSNRNESLSIDITVDKSGEATTLTIRDNAGGVRRENAAMLFGLGHTAKERIPGSIGAYGVGAKKSLVNLGVPFQISSRPATADEGWTYRITKEWFEDDHDWTVPIHQQTDIDPGITKIRIQDLNYKWDDSTGNLLREQMGEAYNLFLSEELQRIHGTDYDLTIRVNGTPVEPAGVPDWSFSPFDGVHPRRFENIEITTPEMDAPVNLHITAGLLSKKDSQNAGTDIYCQKRKIASGLRKGEGGFGSGPDRLGAFSARHERLKIIIELETDGNGQLLPWDTQKSSIDTHSEIMRGTANTRGVYNWVRRTVQGYYQLDADKIPTAFVAPFGADNELAVNDGHPVRLDYSDRKRVVSNHRPDTALPEAKAIEQQATAHATLWISGLNSVEPWERPAYKRQLEQESDRNLDNLVSVDNHPPEDVIGNPHRAAGRISELARVHLEHGVYHPDELNQWQLPRYRGYIERHEKEIPQRQDQVLKDLPLTPAEIEVGDSELVAINNTDESGAGHVHTGQVNEKTTAESESVELFLVFGGELDEERGAKVLECSRPELCRLLGVSPNSVDEVVWDKLGMKFNTLVEQTDTE